MSTPTFNAEDRSLLHRGYPHIRLLVADHPDDAPKKIAKATAKVVNAIDPCLMFGGRRNATETQ